MDKQAVTERFPIFYIMLYFLTAGIGATYNTFVPLYFKAIDLGDSQIGLILSVTPLMVLVAQPFWGTVGDRSKSLNRMFRWMLAGTAITVVLYPLVQNFYLILLLTGVFSFFNSAMFPMQDTLTLQALDSSTSNYGKVRMGSTIGFAVLSVMAGLVTGLDLRLLFPVSALLAIISIVVTFKFRPISGHQSKTHRVSPLVLLKNKNLVILTALCAFAMISFGFYAGFFSIYFSELGGNTNWLGVFWFVSAITEVPFLIFAPRIVKKLGERWAILLSVLVQAVRWLFIGLTSSVTLVLANSLLHGFGFIVVVYCMALFINKTVPLELKASGQSFYALFGMGIPQIIGRAGGGLVVSKIGYSNAFLICAAINIVAVIGIGYIFLRSSRLQKADPEQPSPEAESK